MLRASMLLAIYSYVNSRLETDILMRKMTWVDPTMLSMSFWLGLYAFGLKGIVYGPLLVSMITIFYHVAKHVTNK